MWMPLGSSWGSEITAMMGQGGDFRRDFFRDKAAGMALERAWESP